MTIGADVRISGNGVILDTTGSTTFNPTAAVTAKAVSLGSGQIILALDNPGALPTTGLVLPTAVLTGLQGTAGALSLLSYSSIDIYGTGSIGGTDFLGAAFRRQPDAARRKHPRFQQSRGHRYPQRP